MYHPPPYNSLPAPFTTEGGRESDNIMSMLFQCWANVVRRGRWVNIEPTLAILYPNC